MKKTKEEYSQTQQIATFVGTKKRSCSTAFLSLAFLSLAFLYMPTAYSLIFTQNITIIII